ncbi:DUF1837 domain-containing protein [Myxococcota bacterium]|nr:DUF1837 domain-containing protein [Myxococcota bacterium]
MPPTPTPSALLLSEIAQLDRDETVGSHFLVVFKEKKYGADVRSRIVAEVRVSYTDPATTISRLIDLGYRETARLQQVLFPMAKRARSGNLGEIFAVCALEFLTSFRVPIRRLRWTDGRNMSLRGDDFIGIDTTQPQPRFIKGESKSADVMSARPIATAYSALRRDGGQPTPHSMVFVADRLRQQRQDDLALKFELAGLNGLQVGQLEHMIFLLTGNDCEPIMRTHLSTAASPIPRRMVNLVLSNHQQFIKEIYEAVSHV